MNNHHRYFCSFSDCRVCSEPEGDASEYEHGTDAEGDGLYENS